MTTFALTLGLFLAVTFAMALGVMLTGRRLAGSCGGQPGKDCTCSIRKRKACADKAAMTGVSAEDGMRHLDVMQESERRD